ncbi:hypothetical protein THASP1DRAFT_31049 [Thamnocephalis sphaerospora]|uniref:Aladin seven-bladed propeller domain-containing protein n=1 Tax=Thamnocephalis sphaerospora TaxID=78915 RepID=A0A4P9XMK1_9FUNG|nr:hypothetical protein THASP1DRAFT_31049 [Thamnocephalis sphaerospora]|eukprot:RKP07138.1 hypothetical protein THASP1DRAFT_31049 [Thamnocephalis sphaerospora]
MVEFNEQTRPPPAEGAITVAEIDLEMVVLHNGRDDSAIQRYVAAGGVCYPHVMLPDKVSTDGHGSGDMQEKARPNREREQRPAAGTVRFEQDQRRLESERTGVVKRLQVRPVPGTVFSNADDARMDGTRGRRAAAPKLDVNTMDAASLQDNIAWLLQADSNDMVRAFMKKLGFSGWEQWKRRWVDPVASVVAPPPSHVVLPSVSWPATCIAWHPNKQVLGIAHSNDMIYVYSMQNEAWFPDPLRHPMQRDLVQLNWRPNTAGTVAAVCREGIALWKLPLHGWKAADGSPRAYMTWLQHPAINDVSACAWDPSGQYPLHATLLIWHVATETVTPLRRVGSGVAELAWSPDGQYLCAAPNDGDALRVWETRNWTTFRAAELTTGVTTVCWTPNSQHLLFTLQGDTHVYVMQLLPTPRALEFKVLERPHSMASFVLSDEGGKPIRVGGVIRRMALDPHGERLVVVFEPAADASRQERETRTRGAVSTQMTGSELIAVFMVRLSSWLGERRPLLPSGFIRGPPPPEYEPTDVLDGARQPHAVAVAFAPHFDRGSLLAVVWDHGKVTFVPFFYLAADRFADTTDDRRVAGW